MKITRIFTDEQGVSHFQDLGSIQFEHLSPDQAWGKISKTLQVKEVSFYQFGADLYFDWHVPLIGQFLEIYCDGREEIEVGDGSKRIFEKGDVVLFDDLKGKGHRAFGLEPGYSLLIKLEEKNSVKDLKTLVQG